MGPLAMGPVALAGHPAMDETRRSSPAPEMQCRQSRPRGVAKGGLGKGAGPKMWQSVGFPLSLQKRQGFQPRRRAFLEDRGKFDPALGDQREFKSTIHGLGDTLAWFNVHRCPLPTNMTCARRSRLTKTSCPSKCGVSVHFRTINIKVTSSRAQSGEPGAHPPPGIQLWPRLRRPPPGSDLGQKPAWPLRHGPKYNHFRITSICWSPLEKNENISSSHRLPFHPTGEKKLRWYPQQHAVLFLVLAPPRSLRRTSCNPRGTLVEPWWNLTWGPPRTTPEPIWAETPKLFSCWGIKRLFLSKWKNYFLLILPRSSSREVRIRVPTFAVVYFSRGTSPKKG